MTYVQYISLLSMSYIPGTMVVHLQHTPATHRTDKKKQIEDDLNVEKLMEEN